MHRAREPMDFRELHRASKSGLCFICEYLNGNPDFEHLRIAETETSVAFLSKYPTLFGYTIVAPKRHLEDVTGDFSEADYVDLQGFIYRVAEAVRRVLSPERMYILSLGSKLANAHVHWHVAALPPGIPFENQQYHALMHEHGVVDVPELEAVEFVRAVRSELER